MAKPIREFSADVGQKSMGVAGPDFIERDLDKLFAMLDPNKTLPTGEQGGIGSENMKPGAVTAEQTGALVSVDGVSNPGGDVDFVAGTGMEIIPDSQNKKITFAAKNESIIPGPHAETHGSIGSDPIAPEDIGATATPTASMIAMYDSGKRLSSGAAPTSDNHVVRKVDLDNHVDSVSAHSATPTPTASMIAMYDSTKRLSSGAAPSNDNHVVRKTDLDAGLEKIGAEKFQLSGNLSPQILTVPGGTASSVKVQIIYISIPQGKSLKLKGVRAYVNSSKNINLLIETGTSGSYEAKKTISGINNGVDNQNLNDTIVNSGTHVLNIGFKAQGMDSGEVHNGGWWLNFEII